MYNRVKEKQPLQRGEPEQENNSEEDMVAGRDGRISVIQKKKEGYRD